MINLGYPTYQTFRGDPGMGDSPGPGGSGGGSPGHGGGGSGGGLTDSFGSPVTDSLGQPIGANNYGTGGYQNASVNANQMSTLAMAVLGMLGINPAVGAGIGQAIGDVSVPGGPSNSEGSDGHLNAINQILGGDQGYSGSDPILQAGGPLNIGPCPICDGRCLPSLGFQIGRIGKDLIETVGFQRLGHG